MDVPVSDDTENSATHTAHGTSGDSQGLGLLQWLLQTSNTFFGACNKQMSNLPLSH